MFLDLHLSISNDIVSTKIYDKRDDFDFEIVNFPFLDGDVPSQDCQRRLHLTLSFLNVLMTNSLSVIRGLRMTR